MWNRCLNARDLGGFPTRYGVPTASGRLFRTDTPELLDADGRTEFVALAEVVLSAGSKGSTLRNPVT
ncbi:tyrosine-protein phosphatase [Kribbella sp. NPDC051587]|uniref:tyrosine-protein phosphatase n=1 Tax=Kribbella sp. NPDC051587 TaxID=3364119 RepID=UPI0037908C40